MEGELNPEQQRENVLAINPDKKTFIVPIEDESLAKLPGQYFYGNKEFIKKPEFHITIIGNKQGIDLGKLFEERPQLEEELNSVIKEFDWKYYLSDRTLHIVREKSADDNAMNDVEDPPGIIHQESIIRMVDMPVMKEFYSRARELGVNFGDPIPSHVTLFTHNAKRGIGIDSEEALESFHPREIELR